MLLFGRPLHGLPHLCFRVGRVSVMAIDLGVEHSIMQTTASSGRGEFRTLPILWSRGSGLECDRPGYCCLWLARLSEYLERTPSEGVSGIRERRLSQVATPPASARYVGVGKGLTMTPRTKKDAVGLRSRLTVSSCPISPLLQQQLLQVFDRPVASQPRFYRDSSGQPILDMREAADVHLEVWWTVGGRIATSVFGEEQWYDWLSRTADDFGNRRGLYLTNLPIERALQDRFGVRPNVLAVRPGRSSYVAVGLADGLSDSESVSRLRTARDLMTS